MRVAEAANVQTGRRVKTAVAFPYRQKDTAAEMAFVDIAALHTIMIKIVRTLMA